MVICADSWRIREFANFVMKNLFERYGLRRVRKKIRRTYAEWREERNYQKLIELENAVKLERRETIRRQVENFARKPLISVLLPVYNVEEKWLRLCIESVTNQIYENWELCVADDCSPAPHVRRILEEYAEKDERIKIVFRKTNNHISAASNSALELATGEFVALLDHDDELAEDALFHVAREINDFPETDFIYSDEDMIDETGKRYTPKFKPDFSLDFLYSVNYVTHLAVYRASILRQIGGFRTGLEGSQDYDLALRVVEQIPGNHIRHVPRVLYHWRAIQGSVALSGDEKPYAHERGRLAIRQHLERIGKQAAVEKAIYNLHRVRYELPPALPKVSLIFAADETRKITEKAIENFIEKTDYANYEIVVIGKTKLPENKSVSFPANVKFVVCASGCEAEKLNFAAAQTEGEILCFVDANLKPLTADWLNELISFAIQKEIGAVGAKILDADETILHAGLIFGDRQKLVCAGRRGRDKNGGDDLGRAHLINNFSAVSISCLAVRRKVFEQTGGFDAQNFPDKFFDADFCLRLRQKNYRIVYTPYAELMKIDEKRRLNFEKNPIAGEKARFVRKWRKVVERDPFYNPNLSKKNASFSIKI